VNKEQALIRIKELIQILTKASIAYYHENREIMSDFEYDKLYDELLELEKKYNIIFSDSPTQIVEPMTVSNLKKVSHETKMLSLDKTKSVEELVAFIGDMEALLSWKLDGLTIVLTYENGKLLRGVTRGNGEVGEDVTHNVKVFKDLPLNIEYKGKIVIRGEAVITNSDFNKINENLEEELKYKNPRNLCSGSVRQLSNEVAKKRKIHFYAFSMTCEKANEFNNKSEIFEFLNELGFEVVEYVKTTKETVSKDVETFKKKMLKNNFGSDGLVVTYNDIKYSKALGQTSRFPKDSIAFKWQDEEAETTLREIFWSASRTGLINPVAVFDEVELEGTTVKQASLHNISIMEGLELGAGDKIKVFKANMIIPQVSENLTKSNNIEIPEKCPICGMETKIKINKEIKTLICENAECPAKKIKKIAHFVSRDGMNIEGLSEATIESLINEKIIEDKTDLYKLEEHEETFIKAPGLGEKSYKNLLDSVDKSKTIKLENFIYALGIQGIGISNARLIVKHYEHDFDNIRNAKIEELEDIKGIGKVMAKSIKNYFSEEKTRIIVNELLNYIRFEKIEGNLKLENTNFVITGKIENYKNRAELEAVIIENGGNTQKSVTKDTDFLINNEVQSNSSKNKKAKELGVKIINEQEFSNLL